MSTRKPKQAGIEARTKILKYLEEHEVTIVPSTIREITEALEISSTSVTSYHLNYLEKHGVIKRTVRFIELVKE